MNLWIIGNGFDRYHNLPTSYWNFYDYLKNKGHNNAALFLENVLSVDKHTIWTDFESSLGFVDINRINNMRNSMHIKGNFWRRYITEIKDCFACWASSISYNTIDESKRLTCFSSDDIFINFNYTDTLERFYHISPSQILHIHGKSSDKKSIVFGHSTHPRENMQPEIRDYISITHKNTKHIFENNKSFFEGIPDYSLNNIYVLGSSMSDVDARYFKHIIQKHAHTNWFISYYYSDIESKVEAISKVYKHACNYGIAKQQVSAITIDSLITK